MNDTDKMISALFRGLEELRQSQTKTDLQIAKTDLQIRELRQSQAESQAKTDLQIRELKEAQAETGRRLDSVGKQLGSIGINMGGFAEDYFYSSFVHNPVLGGIRYDEVWRNILDGRGKTEYDIMMLNGDSVAIIEVKYKAHPADIDKLVEQKARAFRSSYPQYAGHKLYLGLATTVSYEDLIARARAAGIYLLGQRGEHVELLAAEVRTF